MATKTISVTEEAYERLNSFKARGESFSQEVLRLTSTCGSIMDLAGSWSDISEKDAKKMEERITARRNSRERLDEIEKRMR